MSNLEKLMYLAGVSADYLDYGGHHQLVSHELRCAVLGAMRYPVDRTEEIDELVYQIDAKPWETWVRPLNILPRQAPLTLSFHPSEIDDQFSWKITLEDQTVITGEFVPSSIIECGDYFIGDQRYSARALPLPTLPPGYHTLDIKKNGFSSKYSHPKKMV